MLLLIEIHSWGGCEYECALRACVKMSTANGLLFVAIQIVSNSHSTCIDFHFNVKKTTPTEKNLEMKKIEDTTNWYSSIAHIIGLNRKTFGFEYDKCGKRKQKPNNGKPKKPQANTREYLKIMFINVICACVCVFFRIKFLRQMRMVWSIYCITIPGAPKWSSMLTTNGAHYKIVFLLHSFKCPCVCELVCACKMNEDYIIAIAADTHTLHISFASFRTI